MQINEILLKQAEEALETARHAYGEVIQSLEVVVPNLEHVSAQDHLREAKKDLLSQLSLALPIMAMYAVRYANEERRRSRVAGLLQKYFFRHQALQDAFIAFTAKANVGYSRSSYLNFERAGAMVDLAQKALTQVTLSVPKAKLIHKQEPEDSYGETNEGIRPSDPQKAPLSSSDYFRRRSRFERKLQALCVASYMPTKDLEDVVVEKLDSSFQRFLVREKPIYPGIKTSHQGANDEVDAAHQSLMPLDFDSINAVWTSMLATGAMDNRHVERYEMMYLTVKRMSAIEEMQAGSSQTPDLRHLNPAALAKSLRTLDIVVGIIFEDHPTVVIWPGGRSALDNEREVIIYCYKDEDMFRYQGIKVLESGQKASRPPRLDRAFSSIHFDNETWSQGKYARPLPSLMLSIVTIAKQSLSGWKPFPFLQLPAEIRNKVYEEYLSHVDGRLEWTYSCAFDGFFNVPELCQTSRQLLSEVLPLYVAKRTFQVNITFKRPGVKARRQTVLGGLLLLKKFSFKFSDNSAIKVQLDPGRKTFDIQYEDRYKTHHHKHAISMIYARSNVELLLSMLMEDTQEDGLRPSELAAVLDLICSAQNYMVD